MNIAFFLLPKEEVVYLSVKSSMKEALEKMEQHRFSAIPLIDEEGRYVGTLTEGDLLWKMKATPGLTFADTGKILLAEVPRQRTNETIKIDDRIADLLNLAISQSFIPVSDDRNHFIGIVRRREIIEYLVHPKKEGKFEAS